MDTTLLRGDDFRFGSRLCEKSREPRKRRIIFSIAVSRPRLPAQLVSVSMKLRQMFYTQIERRTFHTAWVRTRLVHRSEAGCHSITSSARTSNVGETVRPSVLAVLRFITSSNFVGCWTGRSAGFAPFKMASTYMAARRTRSVKSVP